MSGHEDLEVCDMIAQYMILANMSVARRIFEAFPTCALLRRHPLPTPARFASFHAFAAALGVHVDTSSNKSFAIWSLVQFRTIS